MQRDTIRHYAALGAATRLRKLTDEEAQLRRAFPELLSVNQNHATARAGRAHHMSAAQRKAVSIRMKKYWAARRKAKAQK